MTGGNFTVCTNIHAVPSKFVETCFDQCHVSFVNDFAGCEPNTGCYI